MEQLNKYQVSILKQLANSQIKVYCCPSGVPTDLCDDLVTDDFNSILRLVDLGLASDVSDLPKYAGVVKEWEEQGRETVVIHLNRIGGLMFKRAKWEKWKN
jgi:hypothetical protein